MDETNKTLLTLKKKLSITFKNNVQYLRDINARGNEPGITSVEIEAPVMPNFGVFLLDLHEALDTKLSLLEE